MENSLEKMEISKDSTNNNKKVKTLKLADVCLNILASFIWGYGMIKLLFFDFDNFLIDRYFPNLSWVITYKFFIFIILISIFIIITKKNFILSILYITFFPLLLLLNLTLKILSTKNWLVIFSFINFIISFFKSFKKGFLGFSIILITTVLIIKNSGIYILVGSSLILFGYLLYLYWKKILSCFRTSGYFQIQFNMFKRVVSFTKDNVIKPKENIKNKSIKEYTNDELNQWSMSLGVAILLNKVCLFLATKLKEFQKASINIVFFLASYIFLVVLSYHSFAMFNYALFKIDNLNYFTSGKTSLFYFYNLVVFPSGLPDFYPVSIIAKIISMIEYFLIGIVLLMIIFFIVTTILNRRQNKELLGVIKSMNLQADELEEYVQNEFKMSFVDALLKLQEIKNSLIGIINYFNSQTK